jgi:hypothetical protein
MKVAIQYDTEIDDPVTIHKQCEVYRDLIKQQVLLRAVAVELRDVESWPKKGEHAQHRTDVHGVQPAKPVLVRKGT